VLEQAKKLSRGVMIKKGLMSGHAGVEGKSGIEQSLDNIFKNDGIHSVIVGSLNPLHITSNCQLTDQALSNFMTA